MLVGIMMTSLPAEEEVEINRPFAFAIADMNDGTILFLGKVTDLR